MRDDRLTRFPVRTLRTVGTALTAVLLTAPLATAVGSPATTSVAAVPSPAVRYSAAPATAPTTVRLITGDVVTLPDARRPLGVLRAPGSRSSFSVARSAGHLYVVPSALRDVVGRLDLSLFDAAALAAGPARTPVSITYASTATPTAVPGVEVTRRSGRTATGVVTAASSARLATALRTRPATSLFAGVTSLTAGSTVVTPNFPMHTVTLRVVGPDGAPADGLVIVDNVDDMRRASLGAVTFEGEARVSLPAGNYQVSGFVDTPDGVALPVLPEVVVSAPRQVTLDARTATVRPRITTPRPTENGALAVDVVRTDARDTGTSSIGVLAFDGMSVTVTPVAPSAVRHGRISSALTFVGPGPGASPAYQYDLGYEWIGSVPTSMAVAPRPADLQQVAMTYRGSTATSGIPAVVENGLSTSTSGLSLGVPLTVPARLTVWSGGTRGVRTISGYTASYDWETGEGSEFFSGESQAIVPGSSRAEEWNRRPSHPSLLRPTDDLPLCGACLQRDTLVLAVPSFSDNDPHHWGLVDDPARVAWSVTSSGTEVAAGDGPLVTAAQLPAGRAPVVVRHSERMRRLGFPDSTTTTTWSVPRTALGDELTGWACPDGIGPCRALGLLEARYRLPIDDRGRMSAAAHAGTLTVTPYLSGADVTKVTVDVKVGTGAWTAVSVRRTGPTTFALGVPATSRTGRATLRVTATDSRGSTVTQTIGGAWTVAP
ncbi:hypothetical protein [Phycicoccus sonneratiae]|uniref:Uncharacterized protein n=1 Tax=Phycicoccus sonneratiae TaxID=2807628 RepID=A0ABS2CRH0_9MICO|nr:hypothetical protein [Phycicoccus sonneraticus]MBM6401664.1 hypothetical protein [Phycicoccus sonneraticus]